MALKFGPQWLRDLSDGGTSTSQPTTPTSNVKFKLAEYRYGREEMLSLFNDNSPPPDQVRKHLSIFSKEIQKPITMSPLTEDEQRLISQGFNSTVVLRAAGRGTGPPLRISRGGGTADRGRGRGRGRGEGYISRAENGDVGFSRSTQDGWEHVGRKFERSFSRGYDDTGSTKREFSRSSSDNWRDKRHDDDEEEESGLSWRNARENNQRWGPSARSSWREPQRDLGGFDSDRRPPPLRRGFDQDPRGPRRTSDSYEMEGEVPEWVEDDVGEDPGTFDSSGAFVSTKEGRRHSDHGSEASSTEGIEKRKGAGNSSQTQDDGRISDSPKSIDKDKASTAPLSKPVYIPPNSRNGTGDANDSLPAEQSKSQSTNEKGRPDSLDAPMVNKRRGYSNKGDGDSGFAFPNKDVSGTRAPPGQYATSSSAGSVSQGSAGQDTELSASTRLTDPDFLHMEKSLQNLVAEMSADTEHVEGRQPVDVSQGALPLTHENSNKWFYKDPQGEVQGPFTNDEMAQWFSAGYFTMNLVVKRGCDDSFKQLGELIKRYGRVPFLPGPPVPPLISSISSESSISSTPPPTIPSLVSPMTAAPLVGPAMPSVHDPLALQQHQIFLQLAYLKQSMLMRQMQALQQLQEQESFKALPVEQQHLSMQMMMQSDPAMMQHIRELQQLQQQQQFIAQQQQQQQEQQRASPAAGVEGNPASFQQSQPSNNTITTSASTTPNSNGNPDASSDNLVWGSMQQRLNPAMWSQPTTQPSNQPSSLWDVDTGTETISPSYQALQAQVEKIKREREEERLKEEERLRQEELERKQEEIRRQQEDLERQREQMRREKEELERQKQIELQKKEEARRQDEERLRQLEKQQRDQEEEEKRRQEIERKLLEEERKKEREQKKLEEKKKKEEEKRRQQEEQKRQQEELRRKKQEEEMLRLQELQREEEMLRQQELQRQAELQEQQQQEEEERMQREVAERERERLEEQKRQQELQRQQESLRRLQQAQREQLANMQLPASSNWATQQQSVQSSPSQSRSLTEIQEEEARKEQERQREQHLQMQRMQEQAYLMNQQHQQKSWATHASQGVPTKGLSLLDIQQQEQEKAKKSQKENVNSQTYQAKLSLASGSTWTGASTGGTWGGQSAWNSSSTTTSAGFWDQVAAPTNRKTTTKESGEFPALKTPAQQSKKNNSKANKNKGAGAKQKKEEESVQKLFQSRQQDDFSQWVTERVSQFSAPIDVPTFVSFIVEVDSPDDVREYMKTYLGDTRESKEFAKQFVDKRNYFRNQARLEKQQEEDSIWGPAPAINPHNQTRGGSGGGGGGGGNNTANDGGEAAAGKGKNRKKKQRMQRLDGSILGFTVHADSNRKNAAGELESVQ